MLTVFRWRQFWFNYLLGILFFLLVLIVLCIPFFPGFSYMGQNASPLVSYVLTSETMLVFTSTTKILFVTLVFCAVLHGASLGFSYSGKALFAVAFFLACILREAHLYPAVAENWFIFKQSHYARVALQNFLSQPTAFSAALIQGPLIIFSAASFINLVLLMKGIAESNHRFRVVRRGIFANEFSLESRRVVMHVSAFLICIICFILGAVYLQGNPLSQATPDNTSSRRPHVFIFAIDSLRNDRVFSEKHLSSMPFLREKMADAVFKKEMSIGVPRTFPSWVEIASCQYSHRTQVRTMFPSKNDRQSAPQTMYSSATQAGYVTKFISDFAGDVFPRYPFGASSASSVIAPTSNLKSLLENSIITNLPTLHSVLALPHLHRVFPSILENPDFSDPKLVAQEFLLQLKRESQNASPLFFTTFFSTAHFPYAAPSPYHSVFQAREKDMLAFKRDAPQAVSENLQNYVASQTQTIALYDGALRSIDDSLKNIWNELDKNHWLKNSIILVFGDHGENLFDGTLGMGHGDGVHGELSTSTPLLIWTYGQPAEGVIPNDSDIIRSVDIAPTISKRLQLSLPLDNCDGIPLLDIPERTPQFPRNAAYQESGAWFTDAPLNPEGFSRIHYPSVTGFLDIDPTYDGEFVIQPSFRGPIVSVKERAWIKDDMRLVVRASSEGNKVSLYDRRSDPTSANDLLLDAKSFESMQPIAAELLRELNEYLISRGVEVVHGGANKFFYSENIK